METIQKYGEVNPQIIESLVLHGDISKMTSVQKVQYYDWLCNTLGLNPATQPFQIIKFQGKEVLYAKKDATEQLRKIYGVSVVELDKLFHDDIYIVTAKMQDRSGRYDVATGVVSIKGLSGDALANALMKAETKAKRRGTLSICGLGMLDESETDTIGHFEEVKLPTQQIESDNKKPEPKRVESKPPVKASEVRTTKKGDPITDQINSCKNLADLESLWNTLDDIQHGNYVEMFSTRKSIIKANNGNGEANAISK